MSRPLTCTQCGAPLHGGTCEYCGTVYEREQYILYSDNRIIDATNLKELDAIYDSAMSTILTPNELRQNLSCYGVTMNEAATALCDLNTNMQKNTEYEYEINTLYEFSEDSSKVWQKIKSLFKRKGKHK